MKNIVLIFIFLYSINVKAQKINYFLSATYSFDFVVDSSNESYVSTEKMILLIGDKMSVYRSYDGLVIDSSIAKQIEITDASNTNDILKMFSGKKVTRTQIFKDYTKKKMVTKEYLFGDYLITDTLTAINWTIYEDTANISNFFCQKAVGTFKGRTYTVWFAPKILVYDGPWKLHGLPGLIVRAVDSRDEVKFELINLQKNIDSSKFIQFDTKTTTNVTQNEFNKLVAAFKENPSKFIETNWKSSATTSSGMKIGFPSGYKFGGINNKLELDSK